jgi:hypothetical protein
MMYEDETKNVSYHRRFVERFQWQKVPCNHLGYVFKGDTVECTANSVSLV